MVCGMELDELGLVGATFVETVLDGAGGWEGGTMEHEVQWL